CLECGHVGCCNSSVGRHADLHFQEVRHPVMRSFEPGEAWRWCYIDERLGWPASGSALALSPLLPPSPPAPPQLLHPPRIEPSIVVSGIDESAVATQAHEKYGALLPEDVALLLARAKAEDVADQIDGAVVVGCDSVLELDGEVHGKPADAAEATARWKRMR